jgi:hypothetical protein
MFTFLVFQFCIFKKSVNYMPVYLVFFAGSKKKIAVSPAWWKLARLHLKLANCDRGPGTEEIVLSYVSYCQN